ncbi:MAG TPA: histidine kinase [Flavilitoribacter sp.]|nr:histidine kinase [Flavilitoribacter sp.]HMQ86898.1 histidine kinase [Flavilitoribacter sp.]
MKKGLEIGLHICFWLIAFWVLNSAFALITEREIAVDGEVRTFYAKEYALFYPIFFGLIARAVLVYGNAFAIFPRFLKDKDASRFTIRTAALFLVSSLLELGLNYVYYRLTDEPVFHPFFVTPLLHLFLNVLFWGLSAAYVLGKNHAEGEKLKSRLRQENLESELNYLKAQVHPHFLFNTLNNIYAMAEQEESRETAEGIARLSGLLRYVLYDCKAEQVLLEKEVDFLGNVIQLQRLRLADDDDIAIAFNMNGDYRGRRIAPLLLMPFVENAFKHGIDLKRSSFIRIDLEVQGDGLRFRVANSSFNGQEPGKTPGIGLQNVRRRLELLYPGRHQLEVTERDRIFTVNLQIPLTP